MDLLYVNPWISKFPPLLSCACSARFCLGLGAVGDACSAVQVRREKQHRHISGHRSGSLAEECRIGQRRRGGGGVRLASSRRRSHSAHHQWARLSGPSFALPFHIAEIFFQWTVCLAILLAISVCEWVGLNGALKTTWPYLPHSYRLDGEPVTFHQNMMCTKLMGSVEWCWTQ